MVAHSCFVCKSSWCINIKIVAGYDEYTLQFDNANALKVCDGIWIKFSESGPISGGKFCDEDLQYLNEGLKYVKDYIIKQSEYENTLITIYDIVLSICDFQEEGLTACIIEWAAKAFHFQCPKISVSFDKEINKYLFNFENY